MAAPEISVGLPVYNGEKFLKKALDCILNQAFEDFELVISDNASTDSTAEICQEYSARDKRVRYYRNATNIGATPNYNRVFELSRGKFFKWCAHDDLISTRLLRRCRETFAAAGPSVVLVYSRCEIIDQFGKVLAQASDHVDSPSKYPFRRLARVLHRVSYAYPLWGLIRREALQRTRLMTPLCYADAILLAELSLFGKIVEIPEVLCQQRCHDGNSIAICSRGQDAGVSANFQRADHKTRAALLKWADPSRALPHVWLPVREERCVEYLKAVRSSPLPPGERLLCYATVLAMNYWRPIAKVGGKWRRNLFRERGRGCLAQASRVTLG